MLSARDSEGILIISGNDDYFDMEEDGVGMQKGLRFFHFFFFMIALCSTVQASVLFNLLVTQPNASCVLSCQE